MKRWWMLVGLTALILVLSPFSGTDIGKLRRPGCIRRLGLFIYQAEYPFCCRQCRLQLAHNIGCLVDGTGKFA